MIDFEKDIAVLKLSSGLILNSNEVGISHEAVNAYAAEVAKVEEEFHPLLIVGGAVGAGRAYLEEIGEDHEGTDLQALASYGSAAVSLAFQNALREHGIRSGQVMANHNQMKKGSVLMQGIIRGIFTEQNVYTINENDQENLFELKLFEEEGMEVREKQPGIDNDPLAAQLTIALIEELVAEGYDKDIAVSLAIFTEVGGFEKDKQVQPEISASDREKVYADCNGVRKGGSGGMKVKVDACFDAVEAGAKNVYIASPYQNWKKLLDGDGKQGSHTKVIQ
ncbi:hypothetical protein HZB74_00605 [Candidatus Saccharibacteria bacterium]|nr:hypothetical protein [Candidatus Saccharibacteria bacterium]